MDNRNDPTITFDKNGYCNYCNNAIGNKSFIYFPNAEGEKKIGELIYKLKEEGKNREYDCMMGLSGGLDSSYLAYLGYKWGLRILAIHVDDGFDTELATENIKKICDAGNIRLITIKPEPNQYNDLIKAFFKAEVSNVAIPQDNILFAYLYKYAKKYKIRTFLNGGNFALESILRHSDSCNAYDMTHIKDIHRKFGEKPIDKLFFLSNFQRVFDRYLYRIKSVRPLNYIDYNKNRAMNELKNFCDFSYYGLKHCENSLTKVIQLYWIVEKFKIDKRTSHLSSMIVSGQMTREEALKELETPTHTNSEKENDIEYVSSRLGMSTLEFNNLMSRPGKLHSEYKTSFAYMFIKKRFQKLIVRFKG